ncbi:MAG: hypothetical protein UH788_06285 [Treponemataceae bacterium]|nr:hypothetical protein [Treponemataceae bacterium]
MSLSAPSYSVTVEKLMTCPAQKVHIADAVNELVLKKEISVADIPSIMFKTLVENWNYSAVSYNLESNAFNADQIISDFAKWKAIDIVFMYHHPDLGAIVINPKNPAHKEYISDFRKNEMLVVFTGYTGKKSADELCALANKKSIDLVYGRKCSGTEKLLKGSYSFKKDAKFDDSVVTESVPGNPKAVRVASKNGVQNNVVVKPGKLVERSYEQKNAFFIGGKTNPDNPKWTYAKYASDMKNQPKDSNSTVATVPQSSGTFSFAKQNQAVQKALPTPETSAVSETTSVQSEVTSQPQNEEQTPVQSPNSIKKMSPMLSVVVTNELFHNGNVEAWKRIMNSYTTKYPDLQIWIYYEGEKITDINALFKWGKVKHGSCIQFVVVGEEIKDVPKLKRYFTQGASPMFEAFLQGAPGTVLNLF